MICKSFPAKDYNSWFRILVRHPKSPDRSSSVTPSGSRGAASARVKPPATFRVWYPNLQRARVPRTARTPPRSDRHLTLSSGLQRGSLAGEIPVSCFAGLRSGITKAPCVRCQDWLVAASLREEACTLLLRPARFRPDCP